MFRVLTCLTVEHDLRLVVLAGIICFLSSYVAMLLLQRIQLTEGTPRWVWRAVAGAAGGFGIWATHFIAMLAYDPGVVAGYQTSLTFLSLLIAIFATTLSISVAGYVKGPGRYVISGLLFGLGISSMHFLGMSAIEFPGEIIWDRDLVVASNALGVLFSTAAFFVAFESKTRVNRQWSSTLLLTLAVVSLHFVAMGGVTVIPAALPLDDVSMLSPGVMVAAITAISFSLLSFGLAAALFAVRAEALSADSEAKFKRLVQGVTDYAIYMLDAEGRVSNWNAGAERAKGYTAADIVGEDFARFYSEEDRRNGLPQKALETARTEGKFVAEGWRYRKDGTSFWAHVVIDPIYGEDGQLAGYAKITKDITKQKADADRIAQISKNLDVALENMSQGICLFDAEERLILANRRYSEIFSFPEGFIQPGLLYREIVDKGYSIGNHSIDIQKAKATEHYNRQMAVIRQKDGGTLIHKLLNGASIQINCNRMADGAWVATFEDITERLRSEEQIAYMARHDSLTGLANRTQFNDYLSQELHLAKRTSAFIAVIGIDLDKFKEINDQHGHAAGDQVLVHLATRMKTGLRDDEFIARFGGDEFAAVKRFEDMAELHDFVGRLEDCLFDDMIIDGFEIKTGASMGVALYPQDAETAELLLANADLAMYRAKAALTQNVCFYEVTMDETARSRRSLANDLWSAIDKKQFHLHYQVQKSVSTGNITGYEALIRWQHPERGNVPPMDFILLAEECGAILPIGEWVLREACAEAASWTQPHKIAVNLSPVQLGNTDMAALVRTVLAETGLNPERLELEITETSIIGDKERALHTLRQIKQLGVSIAIDDFGTGYSSLETLRSFPFDKIKLDRSFMIEVENSPEAKAIIRAILALGQSLSVPVLAEGVETQLQLDILLSEGCDEAQGYLLGRPKPMRPETPGPKGIAKSVAKAA